MNKINLCLILLFFSVLLFFSGINLQVSAASFPNKGSLSITYSWTNSPDLDTATNVFNITHGWSCANGSDPYVTWNGDNTSTYGPEVVTVDLNGSNDAGKWSGSLSIGLNAGWYSPRGGSGPATVTVAYAGKSISYQISPGSQNTCSSTGVGTVSVSVNGSIVTVCVNGQCFSVGACTGDSECDDVCSGDLVKEGKCNTSTGECYAGATKKDCSTDPAYRAYCRGTRLVDHGTCSPTYHDCELGAEVEDCGTSGPLAETEFRCRPSDAYVIEQADTAVRGCIEYSSQTGAAHCTGESPDGNSRVGQNVTWTKYAECDPWSTTNPDTSIVSNKECDNQQSSAKVVQDEYRRACKTIDNKTADCASGTLVTRKKEIQQCTQPYNWTCGNMSGGGVETWPGCWPEKLCLYYTGIGWCQWLGKACVGCYGGACTGKTEINAFPPGAGGLCGDPVDDGGTLPPIPTGDCTAGQTRSCRCGGTQTCLASGTWGNCPGEHTECQGDSCGCVAGAGQDQCNPSVNECGCVQGDVKDCPCGGTQTCQADGTYTDCPDKHTECVDDICICVPGVGLNKCETVGAECNCTPGDTLTCPCGGVQTCLADGTWGDCPNKHASCKNGTCQCVNGSGQNACQVLGEKCPCENGDTRQCLCGGEQECVDGTWTDCPNHADCLAGTCGCVSEPGQDKCQVLNAECPCTDGDSRTCLCGGEQVCVNGAWGDCPNHAECIDGTCDCVQTPGKNDCQVLGEQCPCDPYNPDNTLSCGCGGTRRCNAFGVWDECTGQTGRKDCNKVTGKCECSAIPAGESSDDLCQSDDTCSENLPPEVDTLNVVPSYCGYSMTGIPASGLATFTWNYSDAENDAQSAYQLQISTSSGASFEEDVVFDSGVSNGPTESRGVFVLPSATNPTSDCKDSVGKCSFINYGVKYYWRVKVWEEKTGYNSGWVYYTNALSAPVNSYLFPYAHPSPTVLHAPPTTALPGDPVLFMDASVCYKADGSYYSCSDSALGGSNTYKWWFTNPSNATPDLTYLGNAAPTNITWTYALPKTYLTKLEICDEIGCCHATASLKVGSSKANRVPQWWEISPYEPGQ